MKVIDTARSDYTYPRTAVASQRKSDKVDVLSKQASNSRTPPALTNKKKNSVLS